MDVTGREHQAHPFTYGGEDGREHPHGLKAVEGAGTALGYLSCVENGTTAQYRPSWARDEGNLARCWALMLPDGKKTAPGPETEGGKCLAGSQDPGQRLTHILLHLKVHPAVVLWLR